MKTNKKLVISTFCKNAVKQFVTVTLLLKHKPTSLRIITCYRFIIHLCKCFFILLRTKKNMESRNKQKCQENIDFWQQRKRMNVNLNLKYFFNENLYNKNNIKLILTSRLKIWNSEFKRAKCGIGNKFEILRPFQP